MEFLHERLISLAAKPGPAPGRRILCAARLAWHPGGARRQPGLPPYLAPANLGNIAYQASLVGIMAVAMTIMLITGAFDLSVASVAALAAAVLVGLAGQIGFFPALLCALCTAAMIGILNGVIVEFVGINAFIVTLGTLTAVRGLVLVVTDGRSLMVEDPHVLAQMLAFESARVPLFWPLLALGAVALGIATLRRALAPALGGLALLALGEWPGQTSLWRHPSSICCFSRSRPGS
jgi:D-xylose transport system permease protein